MVKDKILVVEDNTVNLKLLSQMLEKSGFEILTAQNGEQACKIAETENPDIILLDVMMPVMDGFSVCEWLKNNKDTADIPVVFLTAKIDPVDKVRGLSLGAMDYITKPFDAVEVVARVNTHLRFMRLRRQLIQKNDQLEKAYSQLRESNEIINKDIKAAGRVQRQLLPHDISDIGSLKVAWKFVPSSHVAGDIFNIMPLDDSHVAMYIIDVSGHGVQAAMLAVLIHNFFRLGMDGRSLKEKAGQQLTVETLLEPEQVAKALNDNFPMETYDAYFTGIYGVLNTNTFEFKVVNAGHPAPLIIHKNKSVEFLNNADIPIGILADSEYKANSYKLNSGDTLILYTDGLYELSVKEGLLMTKEVMAKFINEFDGDLNSKFENVVDGILKMGINSEFEDDVSLFGIEIN
ncbi:MAG: SpoIIE family protein phosphatase [Calditrichia bacterium]|nr:SpoIIE family protein phosphatase [Calditrichia bacterium]